MPAERIHGASVRVIGSRIAAIAAVSALAAVLPSAPAAAAEEAEPAPVGVSVVVPITAPLTDPDVEYPDGQSAPETAPDLIDAPTLEAYTGPAGILSSRLAAVADTGATLAIDPRVIASIRALGSTAPASAMEWLDRLDEATNDTIELSWGASDVTAPLQAGRSMVVRANSLDFAIDASRFAADDADTDDTATPDPDTAPPLPDSDELIRWDYTLDGVLWPRSGTVTDRDLEKFVSSGFTSVILGEDDVRRRTASQAVADLGDTRAFVVDADLSAGFASAVDAATEESWEVEAAALEASLGAAAASAESPTVLLAIDAEQWDADSRMASTLARIAGVPGVTVSGLRALAALDSPPRARLVDSPQDPAYVAQVKQLLVSESTVARFATIAEDPGLIRGERRVRLLNALAVPDAEWALAMTGNLQEAKAILESVRVERGSDVNAFADRGNILIAVRNTLSQPVTLHLTTRALNPNLTVDDGDIEIVVEADSQRSVPVPYTAVTNGEVKVAAQLVSGTKMPIGTTVYITTHVQAGWEGPVTLVGGILVFLLFAGGIVRTIVKRRRANAADAASGE